MHPLSCFFWAILAAPPAAVEFCGETLGPSTTEIRCYAGRTVNLATQKPLDLRPLSRLRQLRFLAIRSGDLEFILPRRIDDLTPLARLATLRTLSFGHTNVADLGPLAGLKHLDRLDLHASQVTDLKPLTQLRSLKHLDLSGSPVVDLRPIAHLARLEVLDLTRTQVRDLQSLAGLKNLTRLGLDAGFDPEQVRALKAAIPGLVIFQGRTF